MEIQDWSDYRNICELVRKGAKSILSVGSFRRYIGHMHEKLQEASLEFDIIPFISWQLQQACLKYSLVCLIIYFPKVNELSDTRFVPLSLLLYLS